MAVSPKPPPGMGGRYIEVIIDEEGDAIVEAHGFQGQGCRAATRELEAKLGKMKGTRKIKNENCAKNQQRIGG